MSGCRLAPPPQKGDCRVIRSLVDPRCSPFYTLPDCSAPGEGGGWKRGDLSHPFVPLPTCTPSGARRCLARVTSIPCPCAQLSCEGFSLLVSFPPQPDPWILFMIVCPNIHLFNLLHHHCPSPREDQSSNCKIQNRWTTNDACPEWDLLHRLFRSWFTDFTWCLCQEWSVCIAPTPTCTRMRVRKRERAMKTWDIRTRGVVLVPVCRPYPTFPWLRGNKKSGEREMDVREE